MLGEYDNDYYFPILEQLSDNALKLVHWSRQTQRSSKSTETYTDKSFKELCEKLDELFGFSSAGSMVLTVLSGLDGYTLDTIKSKLANTINKWVDSGEAKYIKVLNEIWEVYKEVIGIEEQEEVYSEEDFMELEDDN